MTMMTASAIPSSRAWVTTVKTQQILHPISMAMGYLTLLTRMMTMTASQMEMTIYPRTPQSQRIPILMGSATTKIRTMIMMGFWITQMIFLKIQMRFLIRTMMASEIIRIQMMIMTV